MDRSDFLWTWVNLITRAWNHALLRAECAGPRQTGFPEKGLMLLIRTGVAFATHLGLSEQLTPNVITNRNEGTHCCAQSALVQDRRVFQKED
jgi:hypothetical protein